MKGAIALTFLYATYVLAQSTTSLFIPVEYPINTFSASIAGSLGSETVFVFDCATATSCGPVTVVQGPGTALFTEADQPITTIYDCSLGGTTTASCLVSSVSGNSLLPGTSTSFYPSASGDAFPLYLVDITAGVPTTTTSTSSMSVCSPSSAIGGACPTAFDSCCAFICAEAQVPFEVCQPTDASGDFAVCTACPGGSATVTTTSTTTSSSTSVDSTTTTTSTTTSDSSTSQPTSSDNPTTSASSSIIPISPASSTPTSTLTSTTVSSISSNIASSTTSFDLYTATTAGSPPTSVVIVTAAPSGSSSGGPSTSVVVVTVGGSSDGTAASSTSPVAPANSAAGAGAMKMGSVGSLVLSWVLWFL